MDSAKKRRRKTSSKRGGRASDVSNFESMSPDKGGVNMNFNVRNGGISFQLNTVTHKTHGKLQLPALDF